VAKKTHMGF